MTNERSNMKIVVIGGTGLIGSKLVRKLGEHGYQPVAASPNSGVNTLTCEGLAEVLKGASVVVDVSNSPSWEEKAVMEFFTTSTRNLFTYEAAAGVGIMLRCQWWEPNAVRERLLSREDRSGEAHQGSSIPYSIVQATQFFEFLKGLADISFDGNRCVWHLCFSSRWLPTMSQVPWAGSR